MTDNPHIRPATEADIGFLRRCAHSAYEQYVEAIGQKPAPMVFDFAARFDATTIEVIEIDGEPLGYMVWDLADDHLFLESIAFLPEAQGKGLARFAMDHLESRAADSGMSAIELYTNEKMSGNLTLYPHLGFRETDRRTEDDFNRVYFHKSLK